MKRVNIIILFLFFTVIVKSQEDSTEIDSLIALELQEEFSTKTSITIPNEITDEHLITYYNDHGVKYDSVCSNLELYREIYGWLGVKYKYAGLSKNGVDCAGFVTNICNKICFCLIGYHSIVFGNNEFLLYFLLLSYVRHNNSELPL